MLAWGRKSFQSALTFMTAFNRCLICINMNASKRVYGIKFTFTSFSSQYLVSFLQVDCTEEGELCQSFGVSCFTIIERFRIAFTANGKREIRVYVSLKKISTQMRIAQNNSDL